MKLLHVCLAAFYIDNYGYQENILPRYHKQMGYKVQIVASTETYSSKSRRLTYIRPGSYINEDGIKVSRLAYREFFFPTIARKLRVYNGLSNLLNEVNPDIIFIHDTQFFNAFDIIRYKESHPYVKVFADCHTDFINSARNWFSKYILHGIYYKYISKALYPHLECYFGTLPLRLEFLKNFYDLKEEKLRLLEFGFDDHHHNDLLETEKDTLRYKYNLPTDSFVIVTGGKIDGRKNILMLMKALRDIQIPKFTLLIFGEPVEDKLFLFNELLFEECRFLGWIDPKSIIECLFLADLAVFPGTHSVLWEEAVGIGIPLLVKYWKGINHLNHSGNCIYMHEISEQELKKKTLEAYNNIDLLRNAAQNDGRKKFWYSNIAKRSISMKS